MSRRIYPATSKEGVSEFKANGRYRRVIGDMWDFYVQVIMTTATRSESPIRNRRKEKFVIHNFVNKTLLVNWMIARFLEG